MRFSFIGFLLPFVAGAVSAVGCSGFSSSSESTTTDGGGMLDASASPDALDDATSTNASDSAPPTPIQCGDSGSAKRVFITRKPHTGAYGDAGVADADALCNALAKTNSISGTWKAYLSLKGTSADARMSVCPRYSLTGNLALIPDGGGYSNPIAIDVAEDKTTLSGAAEVWMASTDADCNGWTSGDDAAVGGSVTTNNFGDPPLPIACSREARVYCFEQ